MRLAVVFRKPAVLAILDLENGKIIAELPTCGDADDVFFDEKRNRLYISCGEGAIAVIQEEGDRFRELDQIPTTAGTRTSVFIPELDRLVVAARVSEREGAALWIFRPVP